MSIATVITGGFGSFGSVNFVPTRGYSAGAPVVSTVDTHDGERRKQHDEAVRRENEEFRARRDRLRAQLLAGVERATGKPPPLDAPLRQLASIARKAEGFDYAQVLEEIKAIENRARGSEKEAQIRQRLLEIENENELIVNLLLH